MRAFQLKEYVGPAGLELVELPAPEPAPDAVLVDVRSIGVNLPDLLMTKGQYQFRPDLPTVPGCEVAGQVVRAPDGSGLSTGDRVATFVWQGSFAEQAAIPLDSLVRVPDEVDFAAAAAMVVNYQTVFFALFRRGRVQRGETVLVMGAGGGIGTAAVQVALGLGARVVAGVADEDQVATARSAGAPDVVVLDRGCSARIRELTGGRGVDAVLDPLGDWLFDEALRALAPEGRILVIGFVAGQIPRSRSTDCCCATWASSGSPSAPSSSWTPLSWASRRACWTAWSPTAWSAPRSARGFVFEGIPEALAQLGRGEIPGKGIVVI